MHRSLLCAVALATVTSAALAQDARDVLEQLKRRVEELEKKAPAPARGTGTNAFNPDISIILQGTAARSSQNPDNFQITGFALGRRGRAATARLQPGRVGAVHYIEY